MSETAIPNVQIPGKAVSAGEDVRKPVRDLLEDLYLLGTPAETKEAGDFKAAFKGPPQSVALIEAGATAATKWWAAGLGAGVLLIWGRVAQWWGHQDPTLKAVVVGGAAVVTAAVAAGIAYLLAQDLRGRAAAAVATIQARADVAMKMIEAAQEANMPASTTSAAQLIPLPAGLKAKNLSEKASNEKGWLAVAIERQPDGKRKYVLVKGEAEKVVEMSQLQFV